MKRRTLKLVACAAITALTLSVTACGGSDDTAAPEETAEVSETTENEEVEEEVETEVEEEVEKEAEEVEAEVEKETEDVQAEDEAGDTDAGEYTTLEDYYNDPTVKSAMDSMFASIADEDSGMSAKVEVNGNEFVVVIKIEDSSMVTDDLGPALDTALEEQADTFKQSAKDFDDVVEEAGACTIIMRYVDPDDNVISEKSFKAE